MRQPPPILAVGDPRFNHEHHPVTLGDGSAGIVTIEAHGEIVLHTTTAHVRYHWNAILDDARCGRLTWARQVPVLMARIDQIFRQETDAGGDPHIRITISDDQVYYEHLPLGTGRYLSLAALRAQVQRGHPLPAVLNQPVLRKRLGLE